MNTHPENPYLLPLLPPIRESYFTENHLWRMLFFPALTLTKILSNPGVVLSFIPSSPAWNPTVPVYPEEKAYPGQQVWFFLGTTLFL